MRYPVESFTDEERLLLERYFTNTDRPVFGLVNLPEVVKGALYARYSRYPGTLRRLFLDEFAADLADGADFERLQSKRAAELYERVFVGFGDDSVAQLGGAHIAVEWASNILTKILQRGRLASYLEQSTRYIAFDRPVDELGGYRYYADEVLGPEFRRAMDEVFAIYSRSLEAVSEWAAERWPRGDEPEGAWKRSIRAKALDLVRGILPAATLSHVGIYASGQAYEQLLLRLSASPFPEARRCGEMMLVELKQVVPSFVSRVERPDRGGEWARYIERRRQATEAAVARYGLDRSSGDAQGPSVELVSVDGSEERLVAAELYESTGLPLAELEAWAQGLSADERTQLIAQLAGERTNRRHRPGRGFESVRYRFEIVSDYGAFRDLQRHRMLTCEWQRLGPELGAEVPAELEEAGVADDFRRALDVSRVEHERLRASGMPELASYALCLAYRIRYLLDLNAREAMHVCELRSGREGHPSYRAVAQAMHEQIAQHHPAVAAAMTYVDHSTEPRLERILAEVRNHARRRG